MSRVKNTIMYKLKFSNDWENWIVTKDISIEDVKTITSLLLEKTNTQKIEITVTEVKN